jgi:HJR/Mrr/RecB family endonuclease
MNKLTSFTVGELYSNDQIRFTLDLENLGGIRPALDSGGNVRHVAILTTAEESSKLVAENPYRDRIEGDILTYTAQGREGDQQLSGRNKRLVEQYTIPTPFFGFINLGKQVYRFLGLLELLRHYQETQTDSKGSLRRVWLFEFRIHQEPSVVQIDQEITISSQLLAESRETGNWTNLERDVAEVLPDDVGADQGRSQLLEIEQVRYRLMQFAPYDFEKFIRSVMEKSGFRDVSVTAASGDGGIDVNAHVEETNDFFAGTHVQVQVKRWRHSVGSIEINKFRGALSTTAKGIFVTTSHYTRGALLEARHEYKPCITLIDGGRLSAIVSRLQL